MSSEDIKAKAEQTGLTYADAGVSISESDALIEGIKPLAASTKRAEVIGGLGGFGGLFQIDASKYDNPVLVSGTDGVGTKLLVAQAMDKHDTIGIDCVAMCVNDILVLGAEPLFFLDYMVMGKLFAEKGIEIVSGIAEGCRQAGCALIGGETAEMPGLYKIGDYDLAGFAVGVVDKEKIIDGKDIKVGDVVIGIASTGLHSNGFSLVRKIAFEVLGLKPDDFVEALGCKLGEELLRPTRIYVSLIRELLKKAEIKGMCNITGGGLLENLPRVLPDNTKIILDLAAWDKPKVFSWLKEAGNVEDMEMLRTFNMGIGFCLIAGSKQADEIMDYLKDSGERAWKIGQIAEGSNEVEIKGAW